MGATRIAPMSSNMSVVQCHKASCFLWSAAWSVVVLLLVIRAPVQSQTLTEKLTPLPDLGQVPDDFHWLQVNEQGTIAICPIKKNFEFHFLVNGKETFTTDAGLGVGPTFSPDGKRWAFPRRFTGIYGTLTFSVMLDGVETGPYQNVHQLVFSADGKRFMYGAGTNQAENLFLDGQSLPGWVDVSEYCFSPDGKHVAYAAIGGGGRIHVDGVPGQEYTVVSDPSYSRDGRLLFRAKRHGREVVIVDDKEGAEFDFVRDPFFSADGKHVCYRARQQADWFIVLDEVKQAAYKQNHAPQLTPVGNHLFYLASDGLNWCLVVDGKEQKKHPGLYSTHEPSITDVRFTEDGGHFIYAVAREGRWCACFDQTEGNLYDDVTQTTLCPDGSRHAYAAKTNVFWRVVLNGKAGSKFDSVWDLTWLKQPDHPLLHAARKGDEWFAVVNGVPSQPYRWGQIIHQSSSGAAYYALKDGVIHRVEAFLP